MASNIFTEAQSSFVKHAALLPADQDNFKSTTLENLRQEIHRIQEKQSQSRSMRYLNRLNPFLTSMEKYGKVVEIFLNVSDVVAFIWGPMKFILITASTHLEALDSVLDAYQTIGEQIPLLEDVEQLPTNNHLKEVLELIYVDILEFHKEALRHFRLKAWRQIFSATWRGFSLKIKHLAANMERHRRLVKDRTDMMHFQETMAQRRQAEDHFKFVMRAEEDRRRDIAIKWLCGFNNDGVQETHRERRSVCGDAGRWLLKDARLQDWLSLTTCSNPMIWMTGKPGAGKSVLTSVIVDELMRLPKTPHGMVAYFYCKYRNDERNSFLSVARSLLAQLLVQTPEILSHLYEEASINNKGDLATRDAAKKLLQIALDTRKTHGTTYLVIDGLDECRKGEGSYIAGWFQKYINSLPDDEEGLVRCLFVSQEDGNSQEDFKKIPKFKLTPESTLNDISAFVSVWHLKLEKKFGELQDAETHITNLITTRADGMFLFAKLMVEYLYDLPRKKDLELELDPDRFPDGLDKAYDRIKDRMFESGGPLRKKQLERVLGWIVCAPRPLNWREIEAGVSIDLDEETLDSAMKLAEHPKSLFSAFVEMSASGVVELVHRTAGKYFVDSKVVNEVETHCSMAILSMSYLNWPQLRAAREDESITADILRAELLDGTYSFLDYASACWNVHLQKAISAGTHADRQQLAELRETLETFVSTHWSDSCKPLHHVSKVLKDDLARLLERNTASEKMVQSVAWSNKQLSLEKSEAPSADEALGVWQVVASARSVLEGLQPSDLSEEELQLLKEFYGDNWFKCPRVSCMYYHHGFLSARQRDRHVDKHDRPFLCPEADCNRTDEKVAFASEIALKKHLFQQHQIDMLPDTEFPSPHQAANPLEYSRRDKHCPLCEKRFTRGHNLKGHIRSVHSGEKPFKCGQCDKTFAWTSDRARHERQHGGEKFVCFGRLDDGTEWGCRAEFSRPDKREEHWRKKGRKCRQPLMEQNQRREGGS